MTQLNYSCYSFQPIDQLLGGEASLVLRDSWVFLGLSDIVGSDILWQLVEDNSFFGVAWSL